MSQMNSELVPLTLYIKLKLAFKLQQCLKKIEPFFTTPSNLKCELIIYWINLSRGGGRVEGGSGEKPVCFANAKKALTSLFGPYVSMLIVISLDCYRLNAIMINIIYDWYNINRLVSY